MCHGQTVEVGSADLQIGTIHSLRQYDTCTYLTVGTGNVSHYLVPQFIYRVNGPGRYWYRKKNIFTYTRQG
jgi:hypothetical protein